MFTLRVKYFYTGTPASKANSGVRWVLATRARPGAPTEDWGAQLGYAADTLAEANRKAVDLLRWLPVGYQCCLG